MASQGKNEGVHMLDDFICEAILAPAFAHLGKEQPRAGEGSAGQESPNRPEPDEKKKPDGPDCQNDPSSPEGEKK